ncbi:MAG TPA: hypothetical protein VGR92_04700 [Steroidobacteraceae bacterium]|nr:hypothetical protein [Steroidobacteraceae bacterium]
MTTKPRCGAIVAGGDPGSAVESTGAAFEVSLLAMLAEAGRRVLRGRAGWRARTAEALLGLCASAASGSSAVWATFV